MVLTKAFKAYMDDIHTGRFPAEEHQIHMALGELEKLTSLTRPT
jgi:hypothetical protein